MSSIGIPVSGTEKTEFHWLLKPTQKHTLTAGQGQIEIENENLIKF